MMTRTFTRIGRLSTGALALALAGLATQAASAATTITFDPDGAGGLAPIATPGTFDYAPGSALSIGAVSAEQNFMSSGGTVVTPYTTYFQSTLSALFNGSNADV